VPDKHKTVIITRPESSEFLLTRVFNAPRKLVWDAWTQPQHVIRWWGPRVISTPVCEMDLRAGGAYRIVMHAPDGKDYPMKGIYREVIPPEKLVYTADLSEHPHEWHEMFNPNYSKSERNRALEILTTITLADEGAKTKLTLRMDFDSAKTRDLHANFGMSDGWSQSFEKMDELLAAME
jgi:uncharacterized protein YndB with AHSA1/START domain